MRTRTRQIPNLPKNFVITGNESVYEGKQSFNVSVPVPSCKATTETFVDTIDNPQGENPCSHLKTTSLGSQATLELAHSNDQTVSNIWGKHVNRASVPIIGIKCPIVEDYEGGYPTTSPFTTKDIDNMKDMALYKARPSFTSRGNVLNFLRELKDFRKLFNWSTAKTVSNLTEKRAIKRTKSRDRHFLTECNNLGVPRRKAKAFLKGVSSDYLCYTFGWAPMLSDMLKMNDSTTMISNLVDNLKHEKRIGKSSTVLKFIGTMSRSKISTYSPVTLTCNLVSTANVSRRIREDLHVKVVNKYRYCLDEFSPTAFKLKALRSTLGLHCAFSTAYEAIPMSFILDWFYPVGDIIGTIDASAEFAPKMEWISTTIGTSRQRYYEFYAASLFTIPNKTGWIPHRWTYNNYDRVTASPKNYPPLAMWTQPGTGMNTGKWITSLALSIQRYK